MSAGAGAERLAARGLRSAAELAATRSHGDRLRYRAGCRCTDCRRANTDYETARAKARKAGDWNGIVPAARARAHLQALSAVGVGRRQVSDASGISQSILFEVSAGVRLNVRARTERAVLAVTAEAAADRALIDAAPTWKLLDELLATGYTKAHLARELGYKVPALQLKRNRCTSRNAFDVRRMYERLRRVPAIETLRLIAALRAEGYRQSRIEAMVADAAKAQGRACPDLAVYAGFVNAVAADLFQKLHAEIVEPEEVPA